MIIRLARWISAAILAPLWWPLMLALFEFEISGHCKRPRIPNHPELGLGMDWSYCSKMVGLVVFESVITVSVTVAVGALILITLARRRRLQAVRLVIVSAIAGAILGAGSGMAFTLPLVGDLFLLFVGWVMAALISATFCLIAGLPLDKPRLA
jgi:hypothetical protein